MKSSPPPESSSENPETVLREAKPISESLETILSRINRLAEAERLMSPEQKLAALEKRAARAAAYDANRVAQILISANAPKRHVSRRELELQNDWESTRLNIAARLGSGFLIALVGTRGNGKTQIAVELMRTMAQEFKSSQFTTAMGFFMAIKAAYSSEGSEAAVIKQFSRCPLLVIDEIGQRSESEWENRLLYELLNRRYNACQDTLLISNQEANTLEASLGPSLTSRMREAGGVIECNWESFR